MLSELFINIIIVSIIIFLLVNWEIVALLELQFSPSCFHKHFITFAFQTSKKKKEKKKRPAEKQQCYKKNWSIWKCIWRWETFFKHPTKAD